MKGKHLIGKQILELEGSTSDKIYAMQQKMSELVWKNLLPELTKMFDRIVGEDEVVSIHRIELDIGDIHLNDNYSTDEIVHRIVSLLEQKIKEEIKAHQPENSASIFERNDQYKGSLKQKGEAYRNEKEEVLKRYLKEKSGINNQNKEEAKKSEKSKHQLLRRYYFDLWLHWLEKGMLKSYSITPEKNWIELVLETLALDLDAVTLLENKLKTHPIALQRLIFQHTSKDLKSIVELYTTISQTKLLDFFKEFKKAYGELSSKSKSINYRELEINAWAFIFENVILKRKKLDSMVLVTEIMKLPAIHKLRNELKKKSIKKGSEYPFLEKIFKEEVEALKKKNVSEFKTKQKSNALEDDFIKTIELSSNEEMESPQFLKNAGIVLIHPFLSNLFKNLHLIEESKFKDFSCQSKAVLLLHFLATGETNPPEYEMVLPKFLCEMPANMPIDHALSITEKEKEEANNLLQAAIEHWGALGGTSPDGLREGFLSREGKLEKEGAGWKLYVEQKTLDILLDQLPWNLSLIKLPWMKEILKVEWR